MLGLHYNLNKSKKMTMGLDPIIFCTHIPKQFNKLQYLGKHILVWILVPLFLTTYFLHKLPIP